MIRLVTANVQHALVDGRQVDLDRLAAALAALDADVVALQEVDHGQPRSDGEAQAYRLTAALGMPEHRFVPAIRGSLAPAGRRRRAPRTAGGDDGRLPAPPGYGVALLSRHPVRAWRAMRLPGLNLPGLPPVGVDEPRVAVAAAVATPDCLLTVAATHMSKSEPWKGAQLRRLRRRLRHAPRPLVQLGDLNTRASPCAGRAGRRAC